MQLPCNIEAERAVLGVVLRDGHQALDLAARLTPEDFTIEANRKLFAAMVEMVASGEPIDLITLTTHLGKGVESIGGVAYMSDLTDGVPPRANPEHYVKNLREKTSLRRIIGIAQSAEARAMQQQDKAEELLAEFSEQLLAATQDASGARAKHAKEVMLKVVERIEKQRHHDGLLGMTTSVQELDNLTTGIRPGELWVVGARPGKGKTAFGTQIAEANSANGVPTLVFELEMSDEQLGSRLLAQAGGATSAKIRKPSEINASDMERIISTAADISDRHLWIDDASELTIRQRATRARLYIRRHKVKLIVVDYLMLIADPEERDIRLRAGKIANALRRVAKDEQVGIVLLAQLKRLQGGDDAEPTMADLKESGDIEAAAHVVLLLQLDNEKINNVPRGFDHINIGKQREGWTGPVRVHFNRSSQRFEDRYEGD